MTNLIDDDHGGERSASKEAKKRVVKRGTCGSQIILRVREYMNQTGSKKHATSETIRNSNGWPRSISCHHPSGNEGAEQTNEEDEESRQNFQCAEIHFGFFEQPTDVRVARGC